MPSFFIDKGVGNSDILSDKNNGLLRRFHSLRMVLYLQAYKKPVQAKYEAPYGLSLTYFKCADVATLFSPPNVFNCHGHFISGFHSMVKESDKVSKFSTAQSIRLFGLVDKLLMC